MRRSLNWLVVLLSATVLLAGLSLPGCGGGGGGDNGIDDPPVSAHGMLRPVRDAEELEQALRRNLAATIAEGVPADGVALPTVTAGSFSSTYTLEDGVDELDFVRYDGTHLFVAPTFIYPDNDAAVRILRTDPASATASEVGAIPLSDAPRAVVGMYVADGRLFLITTEAYFGPYGGIWADCFVWAPTRFTVQVHDVRDPAHPRMVSSATIDGVFVESRRMGDRVVVVSRHTPRALLDPAKRLILSRLSVNDLLPTVVANGQTRPLLDPRRCYITADDGNEEHAGYSTLTSITNFSLADPAVFDSVCYDEAADGVYASQNALYIAEPRYGSGTAPKTRIHKFTLGSTRAEYAGSAEVAGVLWSAGQQDFRLSESDGLLRVLTSDPTGDVDDFVDHRLFVLRPKPGERALEVIGQLPNDARPEEIGKPNEQLFAVRFAGNRAYAVTFRRIDPLYVIDLSTPTDPRIGGELLLPGVSDFLHPVSNDLLLGLGSDANRFKLELFDTSVLEQPQSRGAITLEGTFSHSPALYDRHAFTYLAGQETDRFAVPAYVYTELPGATSGLTALHQFQIVGKQQASSALLQAAGVVEPPGAQFGGGLNRSYINGDAVFYVRDAQVWGTFWSTPSQVNGPF